MFDVEEVMRTELNNLLEQVTPEQKQFFFRMYPDGVDKIKKEKLEWAIQQCERTIVNNTLKEN